MADLFTTFWDPTPVPLPPAQPIRPARQPLALATAAPPAEAGVLRAFVTDEQNSRLAARLGPLPPEGALGPRWRAALPSFLQPVCVLNAGDRIAVQGPGAWQLLDAAGGQIAAGSLGRGGVTLDPANSLFYVAANSGLLEVRRLADGQTTLTVALHHGRHYERAYVARRGRRLVTVSIERWTDPDGPEPNTSTIELAEFPAAPPPPEPAAEFGRMPPRPRIIADLVRKSTVLLGAMRGDSIALATEDHVCLLDLELKVRRVLSGSFLPAAMSLDEGGRIYLVVRSGERPSLWLLTPEGERLYSFEFPPGVTEVAGPPVIAHDHTAYLLAGRQILAVAPDGKLDWMRPARGRIAGAVITGDDYLLVSEGGSLATWDRRGDSRILHAFAGEELTAAPVLTAAGDLLAATGAALYCLRRGAGAQR